jgi:hypothetical protein
MRDFAAEQRVREFLSSWGPTVPAEASGIQFPDFEKQCESFIAIRPTVVSSITGLYPSSFVAKSKDQGIAWFACATTLAEAREAERAGADATVLRGKCLSPMALTVLFALVGAMIFALTFVPASVDGKGFNNFGRFAGTRFVSIRASAFQQKRE